MLCANIQIGDVCEKVEMGLTVMGATAVEDKLQEEVAETIDYLLRVCAAFRLPRAQGQTPSDLLTCFGLSAARLRSAAFMCGCSPATSWRRPSRSACRPSC